MIILPIIHHSAAERLAFYLTCSQCKAVPRYEQAVFAASPHPIKWLEVNRLLGWGAARFSQNGQFVRTISLGGLSKGRPYPDRPCCLLDFD
jgi:hypothetical protein